MDEHCLLNGPRLHVNFLMYNAELVGVHWMSCGGAVEVYGGGGLKMFFNSFPQGSARLPNVRAGAVDVRALVFGDDFSYFLMVSKCAPLKQPPSLYLQ